MVYFVLLFSEKLQTSTNPGMAQTGCPLKKKSWNLSTLVSSRQSEAFLIVPYLPRKNLFTGKRDWECDSCRDDHRWSSEDWDKKDFLCELLHLFSFHPFPQPLIICCHLSTSSLTPLFLSVIKMLLKLNYLTLFWVFLTSGLRHRINFVGFFLLIYLLSIYRLTLSKLQREKQNFKTSPQYLLSLSTLLDVGAIEWLEVVLASEVALTT